jgi:hypothetical protein
MFPSLGVGAQRNGNCDGLALYNSSIFSVPSIIEYCNGFAQNVSRKRLGKHGQRAAMGDMSLWTNVIARC